MAIFPKELTLGFGLKMAIFPTFFFLANIGQENVFCDILELKNAFLGYRNKNFKKLKNWHFSKGVNPWFWSKNGHFSNFFFSGNVIQENVFYDILERKHAFLSYKTRSFKIRKIDIFPNGLTHGFGPIMEIFPTFFFTQYNPGKCLLRYSRTKKKAILGYKNQKFKKSKNWHFFRRG